MDSPEVTIADNAAAQRFEISVGGKLAGFADYHDRDSVRAFSHTEIADEFEGQGLASRLIRHALDDARSAGKTVLPFCPFVRSFIERHDDYVDLVSEPERFDLQR